jgi:hypothetical protein
MPAAARARAKRGRAERHAPCAEVVKLSSRAGRGQVEQRNCTVVRRAASDRVGPMRLRSSGRPDPRLASASEDNSVRLWDVDPHSWQRRACVIADRNLTREEWRYMGDQPYRKRPARICRALTTPRKRRPSSPRRAPARRHRQSRLRLRLKRRGQRLPLPQSLQPQSEKPTAPAPRQEGDPVKPVDAEDRARIGPTPVQPVSPVPPASGNRKKPVKSPAGP